MRRIKMNVFADIAKKLMLIIPEEQVNIKVWEGGEENWVLLKKQFRIIKEARCLKPYILDIDIPEDGNQLLSNGSLVYTSPNVSAEHRIEPEERFCIIPQVNFMRKQYNEHII